MTMKRYFTSLARKIHPPLPKTSRESQQLLNLLTSSFRRHLDSRHPPVSSLDSSSSPPDEAGKAGGKNSKADARPTATERHLNSILEHPLFNTVPSTLGARDIRNGKQIQDDPFGALDDAMVSGRADSQLLHDCLKAHRSSLRSMADGEALKVMKKSGGGSRIVSWFTAADSESKKRFFGNRHTMALAMPYLAVERRQRTVMDWLQLARAYRPAHRQPKHADDGSFLEFNIMYEYVAAEVKYGRGGINDALAFFIRASDASWRCEIVEPGSHAVPTYPFRPTAYYLAQWISAPEHASAVENIRPELFNAFYSICLLLPNQLWAAFLPVYHPTEPNVTSSLGYIRNYKRSDRDNIERLLHLSFRLASLCLEQKQYAAASEVISFTKDLLPDDTATQSTKKQRQQKQQSHREVSASDLISSLSFT
ncbi:hypothetical protein H112_01973 [Trichophyton rubrum D6]|nr:uncharacterized protein TERG_06738 [Trichophyton rubrum CBS 118892]EZF25780.1 hypothetical protein H100_01969 [Trichophyton rubrum MR850]EZF44952.1 hypothetical protein H102_01968 [Trichophyton rubrum CBS 100081]EZF55444.1 hypothetical protein H103_01979 [Trichophyton rubrum CBS 288.86]EZF66185.1 hypothetical protein H104_01954 [Trichophyton rubrum CBS 289.86]EZF87353.1 hypothetical protein H110_01978 [Trichophyton rubrum MR1448]EZF98292.1 hypothetical protein H113_01977 [Trichophyton rubr